MNVLSLFDGMSCGRIAPKELGITPNIYYASEIDKHAIAQTQLNFPDTVQLGSVTDVDVSKLEPIDLLIGGSPCQSFSFAGRRNGMTTTEHEEVLTLERYLELKEQSFEFEGQSYLFWEYMRILTDIRKYNPNVLFFLENVEMGKKWESVLSHAIGLYGVHINSALVSAQNRKRIYWTNIRTRKEGLFGEIYTDIPQPEDRGLLLKDILEQEVDEKYYLSDKAVSALIAHRERNKENGNGFGAVFHEPQEKMGALNVGGKGMYDLVSIYQRPRGFNAGAEYTDKSPTLSTRSWEQNNLLCISSNQKHATISENKSTPLVAAGGMGGGHVPMVSYIEKNIRHADEKAHAMLATMHKGVQANGTTLIANERDFMRIRRLTPTECARLQTIPEWYKWECSETQQYKMLGNGWNIETIKHIFSFMSL
ncbi:DNA (cytosine-5-)-methyltransferase [Prevotella sp. oral taxon 376]|uniref:DNA (cytosine-5-)-methyltransferase n=1 Tax=Prevotella sp. oral taxon 376 TaxID=712466 RepID=UPI000D1E1156|nr:DNA (cytosine-5-)-methyltransferase [Prevotella sp. oral taxon 376]PTL34568.1 DNA (cytosine-5-)-methyltransferase [Prevotella sp. oral taxon 376]PTL34690.1 DNA (cytosine-5-)-methyltransferase [Prevotella sp. oral taxon 376]